MIDIEVKMDGDNVIDVIVTPEQVIEVDISSVEVVAEIDKTGPRGYGVAPGGFEDQFLKKASDEDYDTVWSDISYNLLTNKPSIEGIPLIGDQTFAQLQLRALTNTELENLLTI